MSSSDRMPWLERIPYAMRWTGRCPSAVPTESLARRFKEYRVVGPDGKLRVYKSLDEMPPEIRAMLGKKL